MCDEWLQSTLDYPDSLRLDETFRIIENMNINRTKTDYVKKTTFTHETNHLQMVLYIFSVPGEYL